MGESTGPTAPTDDARLEEIIDVVVSIARNDFDRRATIGDGTHLFDGLATGLNMLSEEVQRRHDRELLLRQHYLHNERLIAVGQLAAGVAHELNNPAAFVLANLTVLQRSLARLEDIVGGDPEGCVLLREARDLTRDNITGIDRIVSLLRELRGFSRLEPGQLEVVSIDDVVADACRLARAEVSYRATLVVDGAPALYVKGDRTKLAQVLTNLLLNAAQAIPEGAPMSNRVAVTSRVVDGWGVVTVSDTGTGMSPETQARLFEPFFTTKPREHGTGLGLAISGDIVHHHGGYLRLADTSPAGTTFEVRLPLSAASTAVTGNEAVRSTPAPRRRARILIIDDERFLLDSYARFFADTYDVERALGGREAVTRLAADDAWDAILCDMMMPDIDGMAVFDWACKNRPALADRMLFCTGGAFTPRGIAFVQRMGPRVLEKPVSLDDLMAAINRIALGSSVSSNPSN